MRRRHKWAIGAAVVAAGCGGVIAGVHNMNTTTHAAVVATIPGVTDPAVTQANIASTICVPGYTRTVRPPVSYTAPIKARLVAQLGYTGELDHLVPLELGGAPRDLNNLWVEMQPRASMVDKIENQLHGEVCSGALTLAQAQQQIEDLKHTKG